MKLLTKSHTLYCPPPESIRQNCNIENTRQMFALPVHVICWTPTPFELLVLRNSDSSKTTDFRFPKIADYLSLSVCASTLPANLRVLLRRFRRKKLFRNEHFKLSTNVVFPRKWYLQNNHSLSQLIHSPEPQLPNIFNLILRNGCFVGVNCSMKTVRLS